MQRFRRIFQFIILAAAAVTGFRYAMGWSRTTIETYCPFGGLESLMSLFTSRQFTCATGERNLTIFLALLALTILARRSFCGWVCPVGAVSEWFTALGRKLFNRKKGTPGRHPLTVSRSVDRRLRWLRLGMLALILVLTFKTGELIFRGFDPYYILFSFHGHDVAGWSYLVLAGILAAILVVPMAWCRYLCPLGIALVPFARISPMRLTRKESRCTRCGICDAVCPHGIHISAAHQVTSGECTLCFECTDACPVPDTLHLELGAGKR